MEPNRWEQLKETFAEALSKKEEERESFLLAACEGDDALRHEALELLRGHALASEQPSSPGFIPSYENNQPPQFEVGQLGASRYRIIRFLARGGMGEVYEAEDLRLNERVALKTFRRGLLGTDAAEILKHEIQSARRVTHPNVCRIYDIAEHTEPHLTLLTMELLEGPTLFRYLQEHGPFQPAKALPLIDQIAAGLQAAHDAGVVHGDFKTGNVILVGDALRPVITDFGLAQFPGSRPREHAGTPGYMAPEQVEDKTTTVATDVYALGVAIGAIIGVEVSPKQPLAGAGKWKKVLAKCLAPDAKSRYQRPIDVARALGRASRGHWWKLAAVGALVLTAVVSVCSRPAPDTPQTIQARRLNTPSLLSISPDGKWMIGADGPYHLLLRSVHTSEVRRLFVGSRGADPSFPVMSSDGASIAYRVYNSDARQYELRIRPTDPEGIPRLLVAGNQSPNPIAWAPKGNLLLGTRWENDGTGLVWISVQNGSIRTIKVLERWRVEGSGSGRRGHPRLSPDGRYIAYAAKSRPDSVEQSIYVLSGDGSQELSLVQGHINEEPVWAGEGDRLLFTSNRSSTFGLWSLPMRDGKATGNPAIVKMDMGRIRSLGIGAQGTYYYECPCAPDQIYLTAIPQGGVVRLADGAASTSFVGVMPAWSPDGKWLAFKRWRAGQGDAYELVLRRKQDDAEWSFLMDTSVMPQGPFDGTGLTTLQWSIDGVVRSNRLQVSVRDGQPKELSPSQTTPFPALAISGNTKLYYRPGAQTVSPSGLRSPASIEVLDADTGKRRDLFTLGAQVTRAGLTLSPDGQLLAFMGGFRRMMSVRTNGTGLRELYTAKSTVIGWGPGQVSFTPDGQGLLFIESNLKGGRIMRLPLDGGTPAFTGISAPGLSYFSVSPDGLVACGVPAQGLELWALDNIASVWERR